MTKVLTADKRHALNLGVAAYRLGSFDTICHRLNGQKCHAAARK